MEISIYSTIDFSKARNLLTERQRDVKAFNPIVPQGGCISILENNPRQYISILWSFINQKTGKITSTTAQSSDSMHYVAIPGGLRLGTYRLKIVTTRTVNSNLIIDTTISNPFEYVEASEDIITIVSRNAGNNLVGNLQKNATVIQPIYVNPSSGGGIPEAPIDGNQYARKNAGWVEISGGGGGGTVYARKSETFYAPSYISYLAFAPGGSLETDAVWTITKRVGSADGTIISNVQYLLKKWSERNLL